MGEPASVNLRAPIGGRKRFTGVLRGASDEGVELEVDPARLLPVLHFDGTPITARFITKAITGQVHALVVAPEPGRKPGSKALQ